MCHVRPAEDQSYAMIITRYQLQRTPASHMNMLCYGVDITLMDTCVSVTCSNIYHTAAFFSVGSDWYSLGLQTRKYISIYCHTQIPKNNIMGALRRVFFCQPAHIDSERLAWVATYTSL